jgi:hypothetical protein
MSLREPYFLAATPVALLESGENCNASFAVLPYGRLDCFVVQK